MLRFDKFFRPLTLRPLPPGWEDLGFDWYMLCKQPKDFIPKCDLYHASIPSTLYRKFWIYPPKDKLPQSPTSLCIIPRYKKVRILLVLVRENLEKSGNFIRFLIIPGFFYIFYLSCDSPHPPRKPRKSRDFHWEKGRGRKLTWNTFHGGWTTENGMT